MRRVLPFILVAGLAAAFAGAAAQTTPAAGTTPPAAATTPAPATTTPPAQNSDDVVNCRYEKTTGSLFSKRVCHTQREWHQMSNDARDTMDRLNNGSIGGGGGG
jgi:invasion protein IalB